MIRNGVIGGIIGQYISDLFFNLFIYNKCNFFDIISDVSPIPSYIAATASGFSNGLTTPYIDHLTSAGMRNIIYIYTNNYFSVKTGEIDITDTITMPNLVGDTIAVVILVWAFNIHAREDYYNHKADLYDMPHPFEEQNDIFTSVMIVLATNLYAYYKITRNLNPSIDQTIDLAETV